MHRLIFAASIFSLSACAAPPPAKVWVRTDGKVVTGNPALEQQSQLDKTVCRGESEKAGLAAGTNYYGGIITHAAEEGRRNQSTSAVFEGCMATKGYVLADAAEAQSLSDSLGATARERQKLTAPSTSAAAVSSR
jgi:hypothetical protein